MAKNLDELKTELYEAFSKAVDTGKRTRTDTYEGIHASAGSFRAAAELARSVLEVEREIAEREEKSSGMKLPGKDSR